ncbi:hypothetical protein [Leifsonia sp. PS1209]|uniref:DUF6993 domain-containing protein n=1 Tax=Leifsonia sp. PS1209 TaxID=2724914 RepID=UPI001FF953C9|nr:hypothetical protein [Leifsonia sp. PS1209]
MPHLPSPHAAPAAARPTHAPAGATATARPLRHLLASTAGVLLIAGSLAGCVGGTPDPATTAPTPSSTPSATSTPSAVPELVPGGTAQQNLPFFDKVNRATLAANPAAKGRDFIDALVAAGFDKSAMQLTVDTTTIGLAANSIQFSVKLGDTCLIGQNGADAGGYNSLTTPVLGTGGCLVGQTRAIDW